MPSKLPQFLFRAQPEVLRRLNWLADRAGCSATQWVVRAINRAYQDANATRNDVDVEAQ